MTIEDYDAVLALLQQTPGVALRDADSHAATARYLERNPGLSFIACTEGRIIACIMSGHDGRRGYLQHLAVAAAHRRQGLGSELVRRCVAALGAAGIEKSHVDVLRSNPDGAAFWRRQGWQLRTDIERYSHIRNGKPDA